MTHPAPALDAVLAGAIPLGTALAGAPELVLDTTPAGAPALGAPLTPALGTALDMAPALGTAPAAELDADPALGTAPAAELDADPAEPPTPHLPQGITQGENWPSCHMKNRARLKGVFDRCGIHIGGGAYGAPSPPYNRGHLHGGEVGCFEGLGEERVMGTRASIGVWDESVGKFYCRMVDYDGYMEGAGIELLKRHNTFAEADKLIRDNACWRDSVGSSCTQDREPKWCDGARFEFKDGRWWAWLGYVASHTGSQGFRFPLALALHLSFVSQVGWEQSIGPVSDDLIANGLVDEYSGTDWQVKCRMNVQSKILESRQKRRG